jgi:hypothetical protein
MALQTLFANNVLRGDASRVIYASEQFAFRQRLNLLAKAGSPSIAELQLPFMSYYRQGNWTIDNRVAVQNATAGLSGFPEAAVGFQKMRWLNVQTIFTCTLFYSTDADAQLGYELLMWLKHPKPQQFYVPGLEYKGYSISIPVIFTIENINFAPSTTEKDWLAKNRIIPVQFTLNLRTAMLSQTRQTPQDTLFPPEEAPVLTKTVILDFLAFKFKNSFYDASHIDFEVSGTLDPETSLGLVTSVTSSTQTSIVLTWDYDADFAPSFNPNLTITLNGVTQYSALLSAKSLIINDLSPESVYNITVWAQSLTGKIAKATTSTSTSTQQAVGIKGIKGYTL